MFAESVGVNVNRYCLSPYVSAEPPTKLKAPSTFVAPTAASPRISAAVKVYPDSKIISIFDTVTTGTAGSTVNSKARVSDRYPGADNNSSTLYAPAFVGTFSAVNPSGVFSN